MAAAGFRLLKVHLNGVDGFARFYTRLSYPRFRGAFRSWSDGHGRRALMPAPRKYPDELRARAVRLYRESNPKPVIRRLAEQLGVHHEALRNWIRQDEADRGERGDRPSAELVEENRRLREEVLELRRANAILKAASVYFAQELDPTRRRS